MKQNTSSTATPAQKSYKGPLLLLVTGIVMPLGIGIVLAMAAQRPQCPDNYTQAQVDAGDCIIGADMSGVMVFLALPFVLLSISAALSWMLAIRLRKV